MKNDIFQESIIIEDKTYFFDLLETFKGEKYLQITEIENSVCHNIISISEKEIGKFSEAFIRMLVKINSGQTPKDENNYSIEKIIKEYQNLNEQLGYQGNCVSINIDQKNGHEDLSEKNETFDSQNHNHSIPDEELKKRIFDSMVILLENKLYTKPGLSIKDLAEKCSTNRSYLSFVIHESLNYHFNALINELRIYEAERILSDKNNNIPLKELFHKVGFSSYSTFNDAFKKVIGITPAYYIKTVKESSL